MISNGLRHKHRDGVSDLLILGYARTYKTIGVRKRLETSSLTNSQCPVLIG
ncbi:hypothetical protein D3C84_1041950 [compost metagenome]